MFVQTQPPVNDNNTAHLHTVAEWLLHQVTFHSTLKGSFPMAVLPISCFAHTQWIRNAQELTQQCDFTRKKRSNLLNAAPSHSCYSVYTRFFPAQYEFILKALGIHLHSLATLWTTATYYYMRFCMQLNCAMLQQNEMENIRGMWCSSRICRCRSTTFCA